jgi:hypothetical protein
MLNALDINIIIMQLTDINKQNCEHCRNYTFILNQLQLLKK